MYEAYTTLEQADGNKEFIHGYFHYEGHAQLFAAAFNADCGYTGNMKIRPSKNDLLK